MQRQDLVTSSADPTLVPGEMIDTDLDECEALQARGEIIWVVENTARGSAPRDGKRGTP